MSYKKIHAGIEAVVNAGLSRRKRCVSSVRNFSDSVTQYSDSHGQLLRNQLENEFNPWKAQGLPPPFLRVLGLGALEKHFNRVLGWLVDPRADHGLGTIFLEALVNHDAVNLPLLIEDLHAGDAPEIFVEVVIPYTDSSRMPDLAVRTSRAALLLENKVYASESGGDQFTDYLKILNQLAGSKRQKRAVLSAREHRKVPTGWHGFISHTELAKLLMKVAEHPGVSVWGRVVAILCATDLDDPVELREKLNNAQVLLKDTEVKINLEQLGQIRSLLPLSAPFTPWRSLNA